MLKIFPIEFISKTLSQTLLEEHITDVNLYGGKDQVNITSFYEQLKSQEEVDRFVETYRDLTEQQNRTGLIMNGVVVSPENPTITNLYSCLIVPMTWTCSFRVNIANRDNAIATLNNLTNKLKGKKVDIAQLDLGNDENGIRTFVPFKVGTIGNNEGAPAIKNGDYIGYTETINKNNILNLLYAYENKGIDLGDLEHTYLYVSTSENSKDKLKAIRISKGNEQNIEGRLTLSTATILPNIINVSIYDQDVTYKKEEVSLVKIKFTLNSANNTYTTDWVEGTVTGITTQQIIKVKFELANSFSSYLGGETLTSISINDFECKVREITVKVCDDEEENIVVPPEHEGFEKYKLSMSFDAIRCDEPNNLNSQEYCELTISGSATLVNNSVQLGNDLLKVGITKVGIDAKTEIGFGGAPTYWLEPMEQPSGLNANTQINQLMSRNFLTNTHTDSIALSLQYTFIVDFSNDLIKQLYYYARYGTRGLTVNDISPNMKFNTQEVRNSWGEYEIIGVETKMVENCDIENTESDTLTIGLTLQIQKGVND